MTVDPNVLPGLLLLAAEFLALTIVGFLVVRVALRQTDDRMALAQAMVVGPALWGLTANFALHLLPGLAGALASWVVTLAAAAALAWRAPRTLRLPPRTLAGFTFAALAVFWVALASRQLLAIPDVDTHLGLTGTLRAGAYPPTFPWLTDVPVAYHHGVALLVALLTPPFGPDLAFVTEVLSAYAWTGFALVVVTILLRHGGRHGPLVLAPLLLGQGAWTMVWLTEAPVILQVPIPAGIPSAGLRASLADIYWPSVQPWVTEIDAAPPNIFKPLVVPAYALLIVTLERTVAGCGRSWPAALTMAGVLGFVGLLNEPIALMTLVLWVLLEAWFLLQAGRGHAMRWDLVRRAAAGPALGAFLLAVGGGLLTDALVGSSSTGLSLGWIADPGSRRPFGTFEARPGGVGLLGVGPLLVAAAAGVMARRQPLVLALALGSGGFLLAAFVIQYAFAPQDITRFDGHSRNLALLALLFALSSQLAVLRPRWRYALGTLTLVLVVWPTVALPVRNIGLAVSLQPQFANAGLGQREVDDWIVGITGRYTLKQLGSERVVDYIRDHTAVDAHILSPSPRTMSVATGRVNASGFAGYQHLHPDIGPQYMDAISYLDPVAVRMLDFEYVHATDDWVASLPDRARRWLDDPDLFELLIRDGTDTLFRIRPRFRKLDPEPAPESFEALRQAVPESATVYLPDVLNQIDKVRVASVLTHSRLLGDVDPSRINLRTDIPIDPLGIQTPDIVIMPTRLAPSSLDPHAREPIWRNDEITAYGASRKVAPSGDLVPPSTAWVTVRLSDIREADERITFEATFIDHAPRQWTGQDWLILTVDDTRWALPTEFEADEYTFASRLWFAGLVRPGAGSMSHVYEFDPGARRLAARLDDGDFIALASSEGIMMPGAYVLAARLQQGYIEAAVIPVLRVVISEVNGVDYTVYEGDLSVSPNACSKRLKNSDSCRQLAASH